MSTYQKTLLDDQRVPLQGAVMPGAKWPATLRVRTRSESYKNYTNTFVLFTSFTQIEGDKNKGMIEAFIPLDAAYGLLQSLRSMTADSAPKVYETYKHIFTKQGRSKEPVLVSKLFIGVKDNMVYMSVVDAMDNGRAKPLFYFGHVPSPRGDHVKTTGDKFQLSLDAATGWANLIETLLPAAAASSQAYALANDKGADGDSGNSAKSNTNGGSQSSTNDDLDSDLPF